DQHYTSLVKRVLFLINDPPVAEDIVQEVLLDFWNRKAWLSITVKIETYLSKAVAFKCIDYLRKHKSVTNVALSNNIDDASDLLGIVDRTALQEQISKAINMLPPQCRTIFLLSRYEELSNKEIAAQLGISVKTVENQMTKALKILRKELWDDYNALLFLLF
ncbi:MAG: RNA polymerase sigma-70 factor, partial [Bacteroidota bacterium]